MFMNFQIEFQTSKKTSSIEFKLDYSFEFFNRLKLKLTSISTGLNYTSNTDQFTRFMLQGPSWILFSKLILKIILENIETSLQCSLNLGYPFKTHKNENQTIF